jgi:hypothetical protein
MQPRISFNYSSEVVEAFTEADCWELARLVQQTSGYGIVTASSSRSYRNWYHVGNRLPDGTILDIEGIWDETEWLSAWATRMDFEDDPIFIAVDWDYVSFLADINSKNIVVWFDLSLNADEYAWEIIQRAQPLSAATLLY